MTQSQKYAIQLDNLRQKYKFTVDNFCSDIVDPRTFRRYKTGEKTMSYGKIEAFCEKLKISTSDFFYASKNDDELEQRKINELHDLVSKRDYQKAKEKASLIDKDYIFDIQNRRHYDYVLAYIGFLTKEKTNDLVLHELSLVADYPKCIEFKTFDFVTISALIIIAEIEVKTQKETALNLLMSILTDHQMIYGSDINTNVIPIIYEDVCIFLLRLHRYKAANYIADNAIKYVLKNHILTALTHFYYTKAYALLMLDDIKNAEINAVRCLATAIGGQNDFSIELFYRVLKKDFKKDPYDFIEHHLKRLIDEASERQQKIPK